MKVYKCVAGVIFMESLRSSAELLAHIC